MPHERTSQNCYAGSAEKASLQKLRKERKKKKLPFLYLSVCVYMCTQFVIEKCFGISVIKSCQICLAFQELSMPFSGGQDSFSKFTMEMVRQYMKEEEMRAAHQSSLLRLREKALKEKTKAELAWLEHQKK